MPATQKTLLACAAAALALSISACGSSTTSETASPATATVTSATPPPMAAEEMAGTLAGACGDIDAVMLGEPDADPVGTAASLEEISEAISTPDAELVENLAAAYAEIALTPDDPAVQERLSSAASALGAGCELATTAPAPN
jgi:hypothetical protein